MLVVQRTVEGLTLCALKRTADRHLFELAFAIAAQYEDLERGAPATKYYLDALEHTSHEAKGAKRERNRVITLDRIAQSYMNRCVSIELVSSGYTKSSWCSLFSNQRAWRDCREVLQTGYQCVRSKSRTTRDLKSLDKRSWRSCCTGSRDRRGAVQLRAADDGGQALGRGWKRVATCLAPRALVLVVRGTC